MPKSSLNRYDIKSLVEGIPLRYSYQSNENTPVWILIGLNVLVFIFGYVVPGLDSSLALQLASFYRQPWSILTSMFVHAGIFHILSNMLALFFFGTFLVQLLGSNRFLIVYFAGGIAGNLLFLLFAYLGITIDIYTAVVGASGAIYALGGVLVVLTPKLRVYFFGLIPVPLWVAIIVGFLIIFPGVAWQAHLGGLIAGLLFGLYFRQQNSRYRIR